MWDFGVSTKTVLKVKLQCFSLLFAVNVPPLMSILKRKTMALSVYSVYLFSFT